MLKFKTLCAVLAYLSSNLLNEVGLSLFRYFEVGLRVCDIVVNKFTFAISSPDEFLLSALLHQFQRYDWAQKLKKWITLLRPRPLGMVLLSKQLIYYYSLSVGLCKI